MIIVIMTMNDTNNNYDNDTNNKITTYSFKGIRIWAQ